MRPFKAVRFSRNSKSGLIRNIINAGIRPAYEKVRSIFPYDNRQNRPVNGLFCLYDLFFGEILVFGQKICQIKILQIAVALKSLKTPDSSYFSV